MNFKRFHESKNLTTLTEVTHDGYVKILTPANSHLFDNIEYDTEYTLSWEITSTSTSSVYNQIRFLRSNSTSVKEISNGGSFTLTSTEMSEIASIAFYFGRNNTNGRMYNFMLNTGSTPQPYEPYSSEVWHDIPHYIHNTSTDTITTLPADIYANDTTATVGLKGNMEQSGTPSPSSVIIPQECGERTGNLFDKDNTTGIIANTFINQSGAQISNSDYYISAPINIEAEETYTWSFSSTSTSRHTSPTVGFYDENNSLIGAASHNNTVYNFAFTTPSGCKYIRASVYTANSNYTSMLVKGDVSKEQINLPFIPFGYKIPILNNLQTTNVYLGEVQSTRRIYKFILDGTEDWKVLSSDNSKYYLDYLVNDYLRANSQITYMCTHYIPYEQTVSATLVPNLKMSMSSGDAQRLYIADANFTTTDQFKAYLTQQYAAGTPVCVWYVLATPETAVVNEPLRKIGDYADIVSGITISTTAGANTVDVLTTLKPSEVSANYHGWHPVPSVHECESGQWD